MKAHQWLLPLFFCLFFFSYQAEAKEIQLYIHDQPISSGSVPPFLKNGTTMVPLRIITEELGMLVNWDSSSRSIQLSNEDTDIKLTIDETLVEVNGEKKTVPLAPVIVNNRTYVPLRFIGEELKKSVEWEPEQSGIFICNNKEESDIYWLAKLVEAGRRRAL